MKKWICLLLAAVMALSLAACGGKTPADNDFEWTRDGYYQDENENMLSVTWMDDIDEPG